MDMTLPLSGGGEVIWRGEDEVALAFLRVMSAHMSLPLTVADAQKENFCRMGWAGEMPPMDHFWHYGVGIKFFPERKNPDIYLRRPCKFNARHAGFLYRKVFQLGVLPHFDGEFGMVHGVLAEFRGEGIMICGVSGMGKSTLAGRLTGSWRALADDCMLVGRDAKGDYWAQPVPTWSLWYADKTPPLRRFECGRIIPLKRIFLLARGRKEELSPMSSRAKLMPEMNNSMVNFVNMASNHLPEELRRKVMAASFDLGYRMAGDLPAYRLVAPLDRPVLPEMEKAYE